MCEPCGRRERYDIKRLTRQNGRTDKLPALVADCPKRGSVSVYDGRVTLPTKERDGPAALEISSSRDCLAPCAHRRGAESAMR